LEKEDKDDFFNFDAISDTETSEDSEVIAIKELLKSREI